MKREIKNYAESQAAEAEKLLKELVVIPAPCRKEQRKAAFCKEWLESRGALDVYVDEAGNVVYPYQVQHRDRLVVVMAHMDIPFEEEDKLIVTQKGRRLEGPGTGSTGNLAALLLTAAFFAQKQPDLGQGILFVASTGARGIGNLYGARQVVQDYQGRIGSMISLEGYLGQCIHRFPGLARYEVKVKRQLDMDKRLPWDSVYAGSREDNPILVLSELVCALHRLPVPREGCSRHLISQFHGGTSPDTLVEEACLVYEISSLRQDLFEQMAAQAQGCFRSLEEKGACIEKKLLASRPCEDPLEDWEGRQQALVNQALPLIQRISGREAELLVGDSEANLVRGQGISALSLGAIEGSRPDSNWESVELDSQRAGVALLLNLIFDVCRESQLVARQAIHWDGLVIQGDCLLQVLDRNRKELILPSYIHAFATDAFHGMNQLVLRIQDPDQVKDLSPVLAGRCMRLELGLGEERIVLPFTNIGGYDGVFGVDGIDFDHYDSRFPKIQDKNLQVDIALARLLYPVGLRDKYRQQYEMHMKKRFRPSMQRLLSGDWYPYGKAPARIPDLLALKKMDQFLVKELMELAAEHGLLWQGACGPASGEPAMILSYRQPGLLSICKILEENKRLDPSSLRTYAHSLFHYVYGHPWWREGAELWNLACDIGVNYLVDKLLGPDWLSEEGHQAGTDEAAEADKLAWQRSKDAYLARKAVYDWLLVKQPVLTPEHAWKLLKDQETWQVAGKTYDRGALERLMLVDDHSQWPVAQKYDEAGDENGLSEEEEALKAKVEASLKTLFQSGAGNQKRMHLGQGYAGIKAGNREEAARLHKREGQDYQEFLKQFMVCKEDRILDLDSFDPIYYIYGLTHYEDMPFIEPLETKEVNRLEELVIVIDTSGSCQGELVRFFLEETWSVFGHAENFFDQFHVRILQCDCMIQEDVKLTNLREVEDYMKNMVIRGGGGTDFRPAFRHIRDLKRSGELGHLKGILYFTDGQGAYPEQVPDCQTAFIFLEGRYEPLKVPYWAKTLILPLPKDGSLKLEYSGEFRI